MGNSAEVIPRLDGWTGVAEMAKALERLEARASCSSLGFVVVVAARTTAAAVAVAVAALDLDRS